MIGATWTMSDTYLGVTVAVLLILSGFFAVAETSLVRMNKSRRALPPRPGSSRREGARGAL